MSLLGKSHFYAWIQLFQHVWMSPFNHQKIYSQRANTCCRALKFKETRKTFKIVHMCALIHLRVCGSSCAQICENCDEKELVKIETGEGNYWCVRVLCVCLCTYTPLSLSLSLAFYVHMFIYACTGAFCACILECLGLGFCHSLDSPQLYLTHYSFAYRACPQFKKFERGQGCGTFFSGTIWILDKQSHSIDLYTNHRSIYIHCRSTLLFSCHV